MSKHQALSLELIRMSHHNEFNGEQVAHDLEQNIDLWLNVYGFFSWPLFTLRDMPYYYKIDTVAILAELSKKEELEKMVALWKPSEVRWLSETDPEEYFIGTLHENDKKDKAVYYIWWD